MGNSVKRRIWMLIVSLLFMVCLSVALILMIPANVARAFSAYEKIEIQLNPEAHFYLSTSPEKAKSMLTVTGYVNASDPDGILIEDPASYDVYVNGELNGRFNVGSNTVYVKYDPQGMVGEPVQSNTLTVNADNATATEISATVSAELKTDAKGDYYYEKDGKSIYVFLFENSMSTYNPYIDVTVSYDNGDTLLLRPDEFELSGSPVVGNCMLTVGGIRGTNQTGTVALKIVNKKLIEIEATFDQTAPIPSSFEKYLIEALTHGTYGTFTVKGTYNDGNTEILTEYDYTVSGDLYSAGTSIVSKDLTVQGVDLSSEIKTTIKGVNIQPSAPESVSFVGRLESKTQTAFQEVDPSGILMMVYYADGNNKFLNLSSSATDHYTVTYFDKEGVEQQDRDPNTLRVGDTKVKFHYTEGGATFESKEYDLPQNIAPATIDRLQFDNSEKWFNPDSPEDVRTIQGYDENIMSVEDATEGEAAGTLVIDTTTEAGVITLTVDKAGKYQVSIILNENYIWKDGGGGTVPEDDKHTLIFAWEITKIVATPVLEVEDWEYGQTGNPVLSGDYDKEAAVAYYYSGTTNAGTEFTSEAMPTEAGRYSVYVIVGDSRNYTEGRTNTVFFNISKQKVDSPSIASKVYTGEVLTADVAQDSRYEVTQNEGGTDVTEEGYDVVLTLNNTDNYEWKDNAESGILTLKFIISQATNEWNTEVTFGGWVYGQYDGSQVPVFEAKFGGGQGRVFYE